MNRQYKAVLLVLIAFSSSIAYGSTIDWEFLNDVLVSSQDLSFHKREVHVMSSPTDSNKLVAGFIDYTQIRCRTANTSDGGTSWTIPVGSYLPLPTSTSVSFDPVIAVSGSTWYAICVALTDDVYTDNDVSSVFYVTSTNGGTSWSAASVVASATCSTTVNCTLVDKPWIAVSGSNIYTCHARIDQWDTSSSLVHIVFKKVGAPNEIILVTGTRNSANNYIADRSPQGCNIAVNSNGVIYVMWTLLTGDNTASVQLKRSFDNGVTFDGTKTVATFTRTPTTAGSLGSDFDCIIAHGCVIGITVPGFQSGFRAPAFPYYTIDSSNNLHLVYQDYSSSTLTDIKYVKVTNCTTDGQNCTFSSPVNILNDGGLTKDQFLPSIAFVANTNTIHATALDRRASTDNTAWKPTHYHCHLGTSSCTSSIDWSTSTITTQQSVNVDGETFIGDYYSATSNNAREAYYLWVDSRAQNNDIKLRIWSDRILGCIPPASGDWIITSSCTLSISATAPANVIVQNGAVLTIPNGVSLDIDFTTKHLLVKSGSGVLIKSGGKIF